MKKILLAAVAALAIVGCTQNEEIENVGNKAEINFGTIVSKTTRAAVTDNTALQGTGFTVYAYNTGKATIGEEGSTGLLSTVFMPLTTVEFKDTKWNIAGGKIYYWPLEDNIQFFAHATDNSATNYVAETTAAYPKIDYTVADAAAAQKDFVVAKALNKTQATPQVALAFIHVLTQVNFSAKTDNADLTYNITSVKLTNISNSGTYNFADDTWAAKTDAGNIKEYIYLNKSEGIDIVKGTTADLQSDGALMLIPQALTNSDIVINYNVLQGGSVIKKIENEEISLSSTSWAAGKKIRYTLNLTATGATVSFDTTVGEWGTETDPLNPIAPPAK
ncbi:fimbrillin family protein [Bacteroides oleiciplenus]|uniref:Fimbrillin family protein n=1 Tax=Bacteroides oleiciplenus TaxID=626931 RepID=A0A3E5BFU3_9BACE|nr:fimbrillin family protein [Bacteroides oleiciplenus]RGN36436.1 fimbrillin family protein [Bacteroides oleiciplenus]